MELDTVIQNIVENEIHANASQMIDQLSRNWIEDNASFFELYPELTGAPDYSECPNEYLVSLSEENKWWFYIDPQDNNGEFYDTEREAIEAAWEDSGDEPPMLEVMEYWIVGEMLASNLEDIGAVISRDVFGWNIWCRTETGQSLTMDSDIRRVAQALIERTAHV